MDRWMMGHLVGAIPNLPAAGVVVVVVVVVVLGLRVVLPVLPSPERAAGVSPALAVLLLGVGVAPSPED
jgi:hypothetical protein